MNKQKLNDYCVYAHINQQNGKIYIGITKDIAKRWIPSAYKLSPFFNKAIKKYGWDNFDHIILINNITKEIACECEKELIKKYKTTDPQHGYNIAEGGTGGVTMYNETHYLSKTVYQYDLDGNYLKEWTNAQRASEQLKITVSDIHATARGLIKQAGGFQWSYEKLDSMPKYPGHWGHNKKTYPPVYKVSYSGDIIQKYNTLHDISEDQKILSDIRSCCYKKRLSAFDCFWMFESDYSESYVEELKNRHHMRLQKQICMYDLSGKIIKKFESKIDASNYTGYKEGSIMHACAGFDGYHKSGNYLWYYYDDTNGDDVQPWHITSLRPVLQFDQDGIFVKEYPSMSSAKKDNGSSVVQALYSERHKAYGDIWVFKDEYNKLKQILNLTMN